MLHLPISSFWSPQVQIFAWEWQRWKYDSCICWTSLQDHRPWIGHRQLAVNVPLDSLSFAGEKLSDPFSFTSFYTTSSELHVWLNISVGVMDFHLDLNQTVATVPCQSSFFYFHRGYFAKALMYVWILPNYKRWDPVTYSLAFNFANFHSIFFMSASKPAASFHT